MTLPILFAVHLVYGALMAFIMERRMRSEGEVLGLPLVLALLPVAVVSTPMSAVLVRWSAGWFLHGFTLGEASIAYERFHLGIIMGVGLLLGITTAGALVFAIALLSRDARRLALLPAALGGLLVALVLLLDGRGAVLVAGAGNKLVFLHPTGFVSLGIGLALFAACLFARARLSAPLEARG
jgi:CBS domain-containing protein